MKTDSLPHMAMLLQPFAPLRCISGEHVFERLGTACTRGLDAANKPAIQADTSPQESGNCGQGYSV